MGCVTIKYVYRQKQRNLKKRSKTKCKLLTDRYFKIEISFRSSPLCRLSYTWYTNKTKYVQEHRTRQLNATNVRTSITIDVADTESCIKDWYLVGVPFQLRSRYSFGYKIIKSNRILLKLFQFKKIFMKIKRTFHFLFKKKHLNIHLSTIIILTMYNYTYILTFHRYCLH